MLKSKLLKQDGNINVNLVCRTETEFNIDLPMTYDVGSTMNKFKMQMRYTAARLR